MNSTLNLLSLAVTAGSFCVLVSSADAVETRTILQTYCLNCHSTEKHKGDLDLKASDIHQAPHVWENVLDQMQLGDMPPKKEKQPAEQALGTVYGKNVPAISGPLPAGSTINGHAITVSFHHTNGGLKSITGGPLTGFQIAGADQQWKPAEAKIVGETVVIRSAEVVQPVAVRYAWKDLPDYSLANGAGLPASPFRTDDWPVPVVKK